MAPAGKDAVLVTGANSFVAGHIIAQALEKGYHVRGTVRSEASAAKVRGLFAKYSNQLSISLVPDITKPELYEDAFKKSPVPITSVIHTASPFTFAIEDNVRDLLTPAIDGAVAILEAVTRYGPSVKRVVATSSFAANIDLMQGTRPGYTYTDKDWNPLTYEMAKTLDAVPAYCTSKKLSEEAMWAFLEKNKPGFTLTTVNPPWIFGPHYGNPPPLSNLNVSTSMLWRMVDSADVPEPDMVSCCDVRDVAAAHVAALEKPSTADQRLLIGSRFTYQDALDISRAALPALKDRLPEGTPGAGQEMGTYTLDTAPVEALLGRKLTPVPDTIRETFAQLLTASA